MRDIKGILIQNVVVKKPSEKIYLTMEFWPKDRKIKLDKIEGMGTDTITMFDDQGKKIKFNVKLEVMET